MFEWYKGSIYQIGIVRGSLNAEMIIQLKYEMKFWPRVETPKKEQERQVEEIIGIK